MKIPSAPLWWAWFPLMRVWTLSSATSIPAPPFQFVVLRKTRLPVPPSTLMPSPARTTLFRTSLL